VLALYKVLEYIPFSRYHNIYDFTYECGQTNELSSGSIGAVTMWNTRTINQLSHYFPPFFSILLSFQSRRRERSSSQLAAGFSIGHATVSRWLSGKDIPFTSSCRKLAQYSGVPLQKVISIAGHLSRVIEAAAPEWPEFHEHDHQKYPDELDEDLITMIEDLIERRRARRYSAKGC